MQEVQYLQSCSGNGKNYQTPIPTNFMFCLLISAGQAMIAECAIVDCGFRRYEIKDNKNRTDFGSIQFVYRPISQANVPPPSSTSLWSSSCILYHLSTFQSAVFGQRAVFDWHGKPSWKCLCLHEGTHTASAADCSSADLYLLRLLWIIEKQAEGRRVASPHRESRCFFSSSLLPLILSSHLRISN